MSDAAVKAKFSWFKGTTRASDGVVFTAPVKRYRANPLGLHDLHGNVAEWCHDWYDAKWYGRSRREDPAGVAEASSRVIRGGSWNYHAVYCRTANRNGVVPGFRDDYLGFRVVRSSEQ